MYMLKKLFLKNKNLKYILCLLVTQICFAIDTFHIYHSPNTQAATIASVFSTASVIIAIIFFILLTRQLFSDARQAAAAKNIEKQHKLELQQYQTIKKRTEETQSFQNTLKEKIASVQNNLRQNEYTLAQENLQQLSDSFQEIRYHTCCSDRLIDAILNSKRAVASECGIRTDYQVMLPEQYSISPTDVCCVLFNLLDNAIEAGREADVSDPFITLSINTKADFITMHMKNSKNCRQIFQGTTTKSDNINHGFGLSIIEEIAEKNDGFCEWTDHGDTFESVVMLRFRNHSSKGGILSHDYRRLHH